MQDCQNEMMIDNESQSSEDSYFIRRKQIKSMRHFYGYNYGIERPKFPFHKISYIDSNDSGDYRSTWNYIGGNAVPDIRIYGINFKKRKSTDLVTKTTMHELAHATHCQSVGLVTYNNCLPQRGMVCCRSLLRRIRSHEPIGQVKKIRIPRI